MTFAPPFLCACSVPHLCAVFAASHPPDEATFTDEDEEDEHVSLQMKLRGDSSHRWMFVLRDQRGVSFDNQSAAQCSNVSSACGGQRPAAAGVCFRVVELLWTNACWRSA